MMMVIFINKQYPFGKVTKASIVALLLFFQNKIPWSPPSFVPVLYLIYFPEWMHNKKIAYFPKVKKQ
jgi:hypothetical protein